MSDDPARDAYLVAFNAARERRAELRKQIAALTTEERRINGVVNSLAVLLGLAEEARVRPASGRFVPSSQRANRALFESVSSLDGRLASDGHEDGPNVPAERELGEARAAVRHRLPSAESLAVRASVAPLEGVPTAEISSETRVPTTADRVVQILEERDNEALTNADLFAEFERRGWIDPEWSRPDAAVPQAARRAHKAGLIGRYGRRWVPKGSPLDGNRPAEEDNDEEADND